MRYKNYTNDAIFELERQRTLLDDELNPDYICENGCTNSPLYNIEGRIFCEDCLIEEVRNTFTSMLLSEDDEDFSKTSSICKGVDKGGLTTICMGFIENF